MAIDRRVMRTRTALYDALVMLITERPYDEITVEDILDRADVGRATFYAHFQSKDHLLERSLERLRKILTEAIAGGAGPDPCRRLFEHVHEYAAVRGALAQGKGGLIVAGAVDRLLAEVLGAALPEPILSDVPRGLVILHMVATFNTTLRWWEHRPAMTPAEADLLFRRLLLSGIPAEACRPFMDDGV